MRFDQPVLLYGAGFVGARLGLPHAEPFAFLTLRFALAALILAGLARAFSAPWPRRPQEWGHIAAAGLLTVGVFSAGVFYSIAGGLPPAASALIIALQPILIALAAPAAASTVATLTNFLIPYPFSIRFPRWVPALSPAALGAAGESVVT